MKSTSEHKNGGFREAELVDQQILHAYSIINAPFKLMPCVLIRHPAYHSSFTTMNRRRQIPRRRVAVRRRRHVGRRWRCRDGTRVRHESDSVANSAAYGFGSRRQLQLCTAVGAIYQHQHV